jgi:hypothetical protein
MVSQPAEQLTVRDNDAILSLNSFISNSLRQIHREENRIHLTAQWIKRCLEQD